MMQYVYEILEKTAKQRHKDDKVRVLKENDHWAVRDILLGSFSEKIEWNIPDGEPPYTPNNPESPPSNLKKRNTDFKYFVKGGPGDNMASYKREQIFIGLLEAIHPNDAKLVIDMINKNKPKGISRPIIEEAFPGLLD
jgi:hypothetical protein